MGTINSRGGRLYLDFRYKGVRCREQTILEDTPANKQKLGKVLQKIEQQISMGVFEYGHHFPNSSRVEHFKKLALLTRQQAIGGQMLFETFANQWQKEKCVEWRQSHIETVEGILRVHLVPAMGHLMVGAITKSDILAFRLRLCEPDAVTGKILSPSRINHIMTPLRLILTEAAERFEFESPWRNIKALSMPRTDVQPFSLQEVQQILRHIREDFAPYYTVRFFTGLRTGEIDGLTWECIDFDRRLIHIRQSLVRGVLGPAKTSGSYRSVQMNQRVYEALLRQRTLVGNSLYVFCTHSGGPLNYRNVTQRVWYPLLTALRLEKRNPYQTRHTAATFWLAAGESPEWIARQLGHANTSMLFRVYSRYVPNMLGKDGSAFESLLTEAFEPSEGTV